MLKVNIDINGEVIGTIKIVNDGTGDKQFAHYDVTAVDVRNGVTNYWHISNISRVNGPLYVLTKVLESVKKPYSKIFAPQLD